MSMLIRRHKQTDKAEKAPAEPVSAGKAPAEPKKKSAAGKKKAAKKE